jgi:hypothetical protein
MRVARAGERFLEVGRRVTAADDPQHEQAATAGESEHRLYAVAAWQEAPFFDDKERAALALTDSVTLIAEQHVPRDVWEEASVHFESDELAQLGVGDYRHQCLEPDRHHDSDAACGVDSDDRAQHQDGRAPPAEHPRQARACATGSS